MSDEHENRNETPRVGPDDLVSPAPEPGRWRRPKGSELRRTAARLRSGKLPSTNPELPASEAAELLEELAEQELMKSLKNETLEVERMCRESDEYRRAASAQVLAAHLLRLKKLPEAKDPDSPIAQLVRELHHLRKNELGRPRKRKKKA